jgi:alpha-mannosidase
VGSYSGIRLIYDDVWAKHRKVLEIGAKLLENAYQVLYPGTQALPENGFTPVYKADQIVVVNPTPQIARRGLVSIKCGKKGTLWHQYDGKSATGYLLTASDGIENQVAPGAHVSVTQNDAQSCRLVNSTIKLEIEDGRIVSLFDTQVQRELIPAGQTGGFIIFEDQPANWDAWDVDVYHLEKFTRLRFEEIAIVEEGPLRASVEGQARFGSSKMSVKVGRCEWSSIEAAF